MKLKYLQFPKTLGTIFQENYWSFYPSEPFRILHFEVRYPVAPSFDSNPLLLDLAWIPICQPNMQLSYCNSPDSEGSFFFLLTYYTVGYVLLKVTFKKDLKYMFDICYVCLKSNIFSTNIHNLILQLEAKYYVTMFKLTFTIYAHLSRFSV